MKEKNKHWLKLVMQLAALALVVLAIVFIWQVKKAEDQTTPLGQKLEFKIMMIIAVIVVYQVYRTVRWLVIYYYFNPDRVEAVIPGGFKGFHHKTSQDIIKILNEAYEDYYLGKKVYSVKKVALWRSRGRKQFRLSMLSGDRGWKTIYARHFLLSVEVIYDDSQSTETQTDYYYFSNGNLMTSPNSYTLELPYGWSIKEDILGQTK